MIIDTDLEKVWSKISKITKSRLARRSEINKIFRREKKSGIGAKRLISFEDGSDVEEHIVGWKPKEYFSYIAVSGLPLDAYHATISIRKNKTEISENYMGIILCIKINKEMNLKNL